MAEYVFSKIKFSPEHKEHFKKILTECEKEEVHPKAACNKEGRFYKVDFEKIIPLPYYWQRINDRNSNGTLIKEIREEFNTFLDIINKSPNENNIETIIKSFIGFIKKSNLASNFKTTRANIAPYEFETLEKLFKLTAKEDVEGRKFGIRKKISCNETLLVLIDRYLDAKYGQSYYKQNFGEQPERVVIDWRWLKFQLWGSSTGALYSKTGNNFISFETAYEFPRNITWKLPDIIPEIPFKVHYSHESGNIERGFLKYIPNEKEIQSGNSAVQSNSIPKSHNVAKVKYIVQKHDIEIIETAYFEDTYMAEGKWNAIIFHRKNGTLIVFDDWTDLNSKAWNLSKEEIRKKQKFWFLYSDQDLEDFKEMNETKDYVYDFDDDENYYSLNEFENSQW